MTDSNILNALKILNRAIDDDCVGLKWTVENEIHLAKLIAIIVMGQAAQAASIINQLVPAKPAFTNNSLKKEAIIKFTIQEEKQIPRVGYPRIQRDGLIFEIISWIAAKQVAGNNCFLKDPHLSSTSQGLDGLMIELNPMHNQILKSTIFEDKCTDDPRGHFRDKVVPEFIKRHKNLRNAELIATAANLIMLSGVSNQQAMEMVKKVMDNSCRQYRAGFALTDNFDNSNEQKKIFKGFNKITNINKSQRIGAGLIVEGSLRDWFDALAVLIIKQIDEFQES